MFNYETIDQIKAISLYREQAKKNLMINFPTLTEGEVDTALDIILSKAYTEKQCKLHNNYTEEVAEATVADITNYIHNKTPIMVANGCLFKQYTEELTPMYKLITSFTDNRSKFKKEMFKYEKGSEKFNKYNMLQMLAKRDNNALYGVIGNYSSALYNLYVATGITRTGRALISHAITFFESFFTNNVKFHSIDEAITFINRVDSEKSIYPSSLVLDENVEVEDVFYKIMDTFDRDYFDDEAINKSMNIIWSLLINLSQETLNKLFYKNNTLQFCDNKYMRDYIVLTLSKLDEAFVDPNHPPEIIKDNLDHMFDVMSEWCYMRYIVVDKIDRSATMKRDISIITDTDSTMPCFNGWYTFVLKDVLGPADKSNIKLMNLPEVEPIMEEDRVYNFSTGEIETKMINVATSSNKEPLRFSIINILSYIVGRLLREHFDLVAENYNTKSEYKECLIAMKNEFLFGRALLTGGKKNYASKQELQEGNLVPPSKMLDVKGLPINKSTLKEKTRNSLKDILFKKILNVENVDQMDVLRSLARVEYDIRKSIESGEKEYYKPAQIKSYTNYDNPMRIQGIKGALVYNALRDEGTEAIDLTIRNAIDIVKVTIDNATILPLMDSNPELYERIRKFLDDNQTDYKGEITSISIPIDAEVPKWVLKFVDYNDIINDNLKNFPLESIGITKFEKDKVNYTNVIKF
jgi:hypothetical protein